VISELELSELSMSASGEITVDAAVHRTKQVVKRALWDYDYRWGSPRDSGWIIIGSSTQMRVGGKAAYKERGPALPMMVEVAPRKSCRRHATIKLRCEGP
jgi:hypothetical protein